MLTFIYVNSRVLRRLQFSPSGKWEEVATPPETWETADPVDLIELEDSFQPDSFLNEAIQRLDAAHEVDDEIPGQRDFLGVGFQGAGEF